MIPTPTPSLLLLTWCIAWTLTASRPYTEQITPSLLCVHKAPLTQYPNSAHSSAQWKRWHWAHDPPKDPSESGKLRCERDLLVFGVAVKVAALTCESVAVALVSGTVGSSVIFLRSIYITFHFQKLHCPACLALHIHIHWILKENSVPL